MLTAAVALQDFIEDHKLEVPLELTWEYPLHVAILVFGNFASRFWREDVLLSPTSFMKHLDVLFSL